MFNIPLAYTNIPLAKIFENSIFAWNMLSCNFYSIILISHNFSFSLVGYHLFTWCFSHLCLFRVLLLILWHLVLCQSHSSVLKANIFCFSLLISEGGEAGTTVTVMKDGPPLEVGQMERFVTRPVTPLWRARLLSQGKVGQDAVGLMLPRTLPCPQKMVAAPLDDGHPGATPPDALDVTTINKQCRTPGPHTGYSSSPRFQF